MFTGKYKAYVLLWVNLVDEICGVLSLGSCENNDLIKLAKLTQKRMQAWPNIIHGLFGKLLAFLIILTVMEKRLI
jgi:hypothetical protein